MEHGITSSSFDEVAASLSNKDAEFKLVKVPRKSFFEELAEKLRELWPPGEKDNKYPWRDSVPNLTKRLSLLWEQRFPDSKDNEHTLDQCLTVARRYLAQFEDNTKYMQTLKYFIMKQKSVVGKDGRISYINESKFADMLEGKSEQDAVQNDWDFLINQATIGEGELI